MEFNYLNNCHILFGKNTDQQIHTQIPQNARVLLIYGGGSIKKNGVYDRVLKQLDTRTVVEFSGVEPNPTIENLNQAVTLVKENQLDFIFAVGGGSVIDGAKYVAVASLYNGDGWDLVTGKAPITQAIPIGTYLTLPATGSESNIGSVVTKASAKDKRAFATNLIRPQFAILNPDVMQTLPEKQLINGIVDAWVHVCEQYITYPTENRVQDGIAETLLKTLKHVGDHFEQRKDEGFDSHAWRSNLMWCANQATNGTLSQSQPLDWSTHMIGHEFTSLWGVEHAPSLTLVHTHLLRITIEEKRAKLEQMGRNVFGLAQCDDLAEKTVDAIEAFYIQMRSPIVFQADEKGKKANIDMIIEKLNEKGFVALGEHQSITLEVSRRILDKAIAV